MQLNDKAFEAVERAFTAGEEKLQRENEKLRAALVDMIGLAGCFKKHMTMAGLQKLNDAKELIGP